MQFFKNVYDNYVWLFHELADPRANNYFLLQSPFHLLAFSVTYVILIRRIGPAFMKNREPFDLRKVIIFYNLMQIILNGHIFYVSIKYFLVQDDFWCPAINFTPEPNSVEEYVQQRTYLYYWIKISDLLDTVFFVLRKKFRQASFLHIYHHFIMLWAAWLGIKYVPGGPTVLIGSINSFIHFVMYSYYMVSAMDIDKETLFKYKKYITRCQLTQFVMLFFYYMNTLTDPLCKYPRIFSFLLVTQSIYMIVLFGQFYHAAYIKPKKNYVENKENNSKTNVNNNIVDSVIDNREKVL